MHDPAGYFQLCMNSVTFNFIFYTKIPLFMFMLKACNVFWLWAWINITYVIYMTETYTYIYTTLSQHCIINIICGPHTWHIQHSFLYLSCGIVHTHVDTHRHTHSLPSDNYISAPLDHTDLPLVSANPKGIFARTHSVKFLLFSAVTQENNKRTINVRVTRQGVQVTTRQKWDSQHSNSSQLCNRNKTLCTQLWKVCSNNFLLGFHFIAGCIAASRKKENCFFSNLF